MIGALDVLQALRLNHTTTACGHYQTDPVEKMGKLQAVWFQHQKSTVDLRFTRYLTAQEFETFLNDVIESPADSDPLLQEMVGQALNAVRNARSDDPNDIVQDEFTLE